MQKADDNDYHGDDNFADAEESANSCEHALIATNKSIFVKSLWYDEYVKRWQNTNALYQIYPRSFMDANNDGVGDLQGIIDRLDYLKGTPDSLGVDAIWISPVYPSPMADFGYDVSDYCDIHPIFGDLTIFRRLLDEAHARGIKVMMDFVPNHTSDQHPWFLDALSGPDSDKRDYYVWRDPKPDGSPPNNWISIFGGSMWQRDDASGQYYLHSFLKEQPDLNWDNPRVREEMKAVLRFWCDMGVDGFRADAVWHMAKDAEMRDNPRNPDYTGLPDDYDAVFHTRSRYGPKLFTYLRELTEIVESYPDRIMILENYPDPKLGDVITQYRQFYDVQPGVAMPFNFEAMWLPWGAAGFGEFLTRFHTMLRPGDMPVFALSNHDQSRIVTRFGREQARLMAMFLLTQPGLPTIYYGDEIGMEDGTILPHQVQDPSGKNNPMGGRDGERTPMQWSEANQAGFTTHVPWLPVAKSAHLYNVDKEINDPDSFLSLYRTLLGLRSLDTTMTDGTFHEIHRGDKEVLAYERKGHDSHYVIQLNFSKKKETVFVSYHGRVVASTHQGKPPVLAKNGEVILRPFEGVVVKL